MGNAAMETEPESKTGTGRTFSSIAIFRALQLGDLLCAIPAVRAICTTYPDADLTLIGLPWQKDFVNRFSKYFKNFIEFPGWPGLPERDCQVEKIPDFLKQVQEMNFDVVLQMQGNGYITNELCSVFGARLTAGLRRPTDNQWDPHLFPAVEADEHEILRFLKVAEAIGAPAQGTDLEFPITHQEAHACSVIMIQLDLKIGEYICMHPGARDPLRRWAPANFAWVADKLIEKGKKVLLTGSKEEASLLREVRGRMEHEPIDLVESIGHVDIGVLAALISRSAGLISNDTGVSHVAAALKIPSVIIFSRYSDPRRWAPLNQDLHHAILPREAKEPAVVLNSFWWKLNNLLAKY